MATEQTTPSTPYFDRFCILFPSFEWIIFGSMHFSFPRETVAQLPDFVPEKDMIVVITGMLEVGTGILILVSQVRMWAALSSLILLVLFIPAVYHILANGSAISDPTAGQIFFRLLLMPNNIFLAICSIHLFQNPNISAIAAAQLVNDSLAPRGSISKEKATLLVAFLLLVSNCAGFLVILASAVQDRQTAFLWAMMCIATGAFMGFLFGVPRVNPAATTNSDLRANTNIETVSDWLTKILVGIGLINFKEIGDFLVRISSDLDASLSAGKPFALALIVYFFAVGLIQGYLLTRMFLSGQFSTETRS